MKLPEAAAVKPSVYVVDRLLCVEPSRRDRHITNFTRQPHIIDTHQFQ